MPPKLHWVTYDPTEKGPRQIESSVRLHLSARAKTKRFHKIEAKKDGVLRSRARDIVGWHRTPQDIDIGEYDAAQGDSSEASSSRSDSSSPPEPPSELASLELHAEFAQTSGTIVMAPALQPGPTVSPNPTRSLSLKAEDGLGDFALPLIQYVTAVWLPTALSIPLNCQIGGHSPIYDGDNELAHKLLRRAFQSKQNFFPLALSAFVSARMKFASSIPLNRGHEPEYFAGQAIRALREEIVGDSFVVKSMTRSEDLESTALGLAFLMLTASFTQADHKAINLYGRMLNHAVCELGGVTRLSEFASYFVVVTDFLTASANLCDTSLSVGEQETEKDVGVPSCNPPAEMGLGDRHSRLRASIEFHQIMQPVLRLILSSDDALVASMRSYLLIYSATFYRTATCVLRPEYQDLALAARSYNGSQIRLITADNIASRARYMAVSLWLRLLTLRFLNEECRTLADSSILQPEVMAKDGCQILECLTVAQKELQDTGWTIPSWLVIWIVALVSCLLPLQRDHGIGPRILEAEQIYGLFQTPTFAQCKSMMDRAGVEHVLAGALPLDGFDGFEVAILLEIVQDGKFRRADFWLS